MTNPTPHGQVPEALRLAQELDAVPETGADPQTIQEAAAELRRQHARIAELEAQLEAIGAGGVAPLIGQQTRDSFTAADMATAAEEGYRDGAAELRRQHARIAELEARIKTMAEEHADELMVAHLDGRMRAAQPAGVQQPGAGTWTPLPGTLPEPGKPVLLDIGKEYPIRAMWAAKFTLPVGMEDDSGFGEHDELTDEWYCPEGWYEWNEHEECHWRVDETPVAWCELPPKEQK